MRLALIQPEIPQNVGAILRLGACMGVGIDLIGPLGFIASDKRMRRAGMDYLELAEMQRHDSWGSFVERSSGRLVLLTTKGEDSLYDFEFKPSDVLMFGSESAGAPDYVHQAATARLRLPMRVEARSLNIALAAALALGEGLRQTNELPKEIRI
jgi:tRNA (cytidine/uridine-2'-O-)-methyltransferase